MGRLHIVREHQLAWAAACDIASTWRRAGEERWGLQCEHQVLEGHEIVGFRGPGVSGQFWVYPDRFEIEATLGFLLSAYQGRIASEIERQLDEALR